MISIFIKQIIDNIIEIQFCFIIYKIKTIEFYIIININVRLLMWVMKFKYKYILKFNI